MTFNARHATICLILAAFISGCVMFTPENQARQKALAQELVSLKADYDAIKAKVDAGEIPIAEGVAALKKVTDQREAVIAEKERLASQGVPAWQFYLSLAFNIVTTYAGGFGGPRLAMFLGKWIPIFKHGVTAVTNVVRVVETAAKKDEPAKKNGEILGVKGRLEKLGDPMVDETVKTLFPGSSDDPKKAT